MEQSPDRHKNTREEKTRSDKVASSSTHIADDSKLKRPHAVRSISSSVTVAQATKGKYIPGSRGAKSRPSNGAPEMGIKSMEVLDDSYVVQTVEIIKRPGQTLGFYIREGNGFDRQDGVFISRIQMGTVAESNGLLHVGDEIVTVNTVAVTHMSLDDVVILMSIPKKLVLTIRTRRNCNNKNKSCPSLALSEREDPPVVVLKKGRSSSASALEMTEKCPDAFDHYAHPVPHQFHQSEHVSKKDACQEKPTSSRYASIYISPQRAEARLVPDESGMDSGGSSDGSLPRSLDLPVNRHGQKPTPALEASIDSPGSYISPSSTILGQYSFTGDREYYKYLLPETTARKPPLKSPSRGPIVSHSQPRMVQQEDPHAIYVNVDAIYGMTNPHHKDYVSYRGYHEEKKPPERIRDMIHSKTRYGRLLRSRSPECYNSDSEVIYSHPRQVDPRGFASDYEAYTGAISDDDGPVYSVPHISASSSSELHHLLKKFTTLSQELQQEQSKLQRQLSARDKTRTSVMSLPRPEANLSDDHLQRPLTSGRGSPGPSRRAASTQTPGIHPRLQRKTSQDSPLVYRTYQMDDSTDSGEPRYANVLPLSRSGILSGGLPLSTSQASFSERSKSVDTSVIRPSRFKDLQFTKKPLHIPYSEFEPYKADIRKRVEISRISGLDGLLMIHIMSGQGLKSSKTTLRDLYCVVAVDSVNKARTMIRTGAINFDWDEAFDVDLEDSKEVSFLIYHWDPNYKHRLCFHGSVLLPGYVQSGQKKFVAIKMEPKGILFLTLLYKEPAISLQRLPSVRKNGLFGVELETVIKRESTGLCAPCVPILVRKCIDEVERRGLETIGIYRLCGSARRKAMLREAFEKNAEGVDLSAENISDIHVITGVLKDYLRELPEPLFTNALYQMLLDALSVRLPGDPEGSATLMLSVLECLPQANQETMTKVLNHLKRVAAHSDKNKMTLDNLAICFGPVLLCPSPITSNEAALDFKKHIEVLKYLLEIWDESSSSSLSKSPTAETVISVDTKSGTETTDSPDGAQKQTDNVES
ncbi:uncharacterized protein LOC126817219 [Patella vulgata]|uniref:uncharacterized protein LOC126817219 n=1 Tax=Patella vulgata TaxID=6465 RepID=UPI0024A9F611|nr:uncharacterized protein LOC126817219 [Patella vulgata]